MQFSSSTQHIATLLQAAGHPHTPLMLSDAARTAQQAADGLGVALGQIAKSIIFRRKPDDVAVLVVTSGDRRVDEKKVQSLVCAQGQKLSRTAAGHPHAVFELTPEQLKALTQADFADVAQLAEAVQAV